MLLHTLFDFSCSVLVLLEPSFLSGIILIIQPSPFFLHLGPSNLFCSSTFTLVKVLKKLLPSTVLNLRKFHVGKATKENSKIPWETNSKKKPAYVVSACGNIWCHVVKTTVYHHTLLQLLYGTLAITVLAIAKQ